MTSVVDTSVKFFHSGMALPNQITGQVGAYLPVLLACLQDGFDTVTLTSLVVSGGVATCTFPSTHSSETDAVVLIAGVTGGPTGWADLNGEQKITGKAGSTVTFNTTAANGTATGTVTMKMAPAGMTRVYTGTSLAVYRSDDLTGNRFFYRFNDTGAQEIRVIGYESMSAISTGTGLFPTAAQLSGGVYMAKSEAADATAVPWAMFTNGKTVFLCVDSGYSLSPSYDAFQVYGFGDGKKLMLGSDPYCAFVCGGVSSMGWGNTLAQMGQANAFYMPRAVGGAGTAVLADTQPTLGNLGQFSGGGSAGVGSYPGDADTLFLHKLLAATSTMATYGPRAIVPGLVQCAQLLPNDATFPVLGSITGAGEWAGRKLKAIGVSAGFSSASNGQRVFFDVTGPW